MAEPFTIRERVSILRTESYVEQLVGEFDHNRNGRIEAGAEQVHSEGHRLVDSLFAGRSHVSVGDLQSLVQGMTPPVNNPLRAGLNPKVHAFDAKAVGRWEFKDLGTVPTGEAPTTHVQVAGQTLTMEGAVFTPGSGWNYLTGELSRDRYDHRVLRVDLTARRGQTGSFASVGARGFKASLDNLEPGTYVLHVRRWTEDSGGRAGQETFHLQVQDNDGFWESTVRSTAK